MQIRCFQYFKGNATDGWLCSKEPFTVWPFWAILALLRLLWALFGPFSYEDPFRKVSTFFTFTLDGAVRKSLFISVRHV